MISVLKSILYFLHFAHLLRACSGLTYEDMVALHQKKVDTFAYNAQVRPLKDQSDILNVSVGFGLVSLESLDEISQSFTCNVFVRLSWTDEILAWDPEEYGNATVMVPQIEQIWKPRLILINTRYKRDPFEDDLSPFFVRYDGSVTWLPGGLLGAACQLDVTKFPNDIQECSLIFQSMNYGSSKVRFDAINEDGLLYFYTPHSLWDVKKINVSTFERLNGMEAGGVKVTLILARNPEYFMSTTVFPLSLITLLSFFAYVLPADSGERVGFAMTVLLSHGFFLTTTTDMLPRTSRTIPNTTLFLLSLFMNSTFIAVVTIIVVLLHSGDERRDMTQQISPETSPARHLEYHSAARSCTRRRIAKWINLCSLVISLAWWIIMTAWFILA